MRSNDTINSQERKSSPALYLSQQERNDEWLVDLDLVINIFKSMAYAIFM